MNDEALTRNYDNVQRILAGGEIKISIKGLTKNLGCSPGNRKICGNLTKNACCIHHSKEHHTAFNKEEIDGLPAEVRQYVNEDGTVQFDEKGHCRLIPFCIKDPKHKPLTCAFAPLGFNKNGRLIIKRQAWTKPCPFYGKGDPIYISMKDCLIDVFGEEIYKHICWMIEQGVEESIPGALLN